MKAKGFLVVGVVILLVVAAYFGLSSLSVLEGQEKEFYQGMTCDVPQDCYDEFAQNVPRATLDAQLIAENVELICVSNTCGVQSK